MKAFTPDDGTEPVRVHQTMRFTSALIDDEVAFTKLVSQQLREALRNGQNVLVLAPHERRNGD